MRPEQLREFLGRPYTRNDSCGYYLGCFEPMYFLYPDAPRFLLPERQELFFEFALEKLCEEFEEVPMHDAKAGDILVFSLAGRL